MKIKLFVLIFFALFVGVAFSQEGFSNDFGQNGTEGITSDGTTITFSLPVVFNGTATFNSTVNMVFATNEAMYQNDADADTMFWKISGGNATDMLGTAGALIALWKVNGNTLFAADSTGQFGFGTIPVSALHVTGGNISTPFRIDNQTNAVDGTQIVQQYYLGASDGVEYIAGSIGSESSGTWTSTSGTRDSDLIFNAVLNGSEVEHMRLLSGGNLGLGEVLPPEALTIYRASPFVEIGTGSSNHVRMGRNAGTGNFEITHTLSGVSDEVVFSFQENANPNIFFPKGEIGIGFSLPIADFHINTGDDLTSLGEQTRTYAATQTTSATTTTIATISTLSNESYTIKALVAVSIDGSGTTNGYEILAVYENDAGTLVEVGENVTEIGDDAGMNCAFAVSGTDIILQATSVAGTFEWVPVITIIGVSPAN